MFKTLNFPESELKIYQSENNYSVFDVFRKKNVRLTPEEWVRQQFLHYLVKHFQYSVSLIAVEITVMLNGISKRSDAVVFNNCKEPKILLEFKSYNVKITQSSIDQAMRYNITLKVPYLIITNGLQLFIIHYNSKDDKYMLLNDIPNINELINS